MKDETSQAPEPQLSEKDKHAKALAEAAKVVEHAKMKATFIRCFNHCPIIG